MAELAVHQVRNGARVLRFNAVVLGSATSQRGSVPRWSELAVYRLEDGTYLISKVGRSTVAHSPACLRVNHRMVPWSKAAAAGENLVHRVQCPDCRPALAPIQHDAMLEATRYRAVMAPTAQHAVETLSEDRGVLLMPKVIRDVLDQCAAADPAFAEALTARPAAVLP